MELNKASTHQLRIRAQYEGDQYSAAGEFDFTVTLENKCVDASLVISQDILTTYPNIEYNIYKAAESQNLPTSFVSSTETTAPCPQIEFGIVNTDGSVPDQNVFTISSNAFTIESDDVSKIDTYNLKLTAKYIGSIYTKKGELPFTVDVTDPCATAELQIDSSILSSDTGSPWIEYKGYDLWIQGDVDKIKEWESKHSWSELQQMIIDNGWSGVTLRYGIAYFKKVDYRLNSEHFTSCGDCDTWIYDATKNIDYKIGYTADVQTFTGGKITSSESNCPDYFFMVEDEFGEVPDASIFTMDSGLGKLTTFSTALEKAGTYALQLVVRYDGDPAHYDK